MALIIIPVVLVVWYVLAFRYFEDKKNKEKLAALRDSWGKPKPRFETLAFDRIAMYSLHKNEPTFHRLTQQTLLDIDFPEVFAFTDRTTSKIGQQYFFDLLTHPHNDIAKLESRETNIRYFVENPKNREEIQMELLHLGQNDAYHLASLFRPTSLTRPAWLKYARLNILLPVLFLSLSTSYAAMLVLLIVSLSINVLIHYWNKKNIYQYILSYSQLNTTVDVCGSIMRKGPHFEDKSVREGVASLRAFQHQLNLLDRTSEQGLKGDLSLIFTYFIELLKAFFLIEVFMLFQLNEKLESKRGAIKALFDYLGEIDTAISITSLRSGSQVTCKPTFLAKEGNLQVLNIYHPLIDNCATNSIIINKGILVTGSNMSGKTTFLRTLIINSILAQTINTCFADEFKSPIVRQFSSIRIDDNLLDGKSYYYEEVGLMGRLIAEAQSDQQNLFVLDEVFKGTNTTERIAASKAILSYLVQTGNFVIVSTHDIELAKMVYDEYDIYHFTEVIEKERLEFDHKLKPGVLNTTNAIRILELFAYPIEIVEEAKAVCAMRGKDKYK